MRGTRQTKRKNEWTKCDGKDERIRERGGNPEIKEVWTKDGGIIRKKEEEKVKER